MAKKYIGSRTKFNEEQLIFAPQTSVVFSKDSIEERNKELSKNMGKYVMYKENLVPPIGTIVDPNRVDENLKSKSDERGLLGFYNKSNKPYYEVTNIKNTTTYKWGDQYKDYADYVFGVFGNEYKLINYSRYLDKAFEYVGEENTNEYSLVRNIERLLGSNDIKYNTLKDKVGIVDNITPSLSLAGVVATNINNNSGTDTPLGLATNIAYATTLINSAQYNSTKKRQYITKNLINEYGLNMDTIHKINNIFNINESTGRGEILWTINGFELQNYVPSQPAELSSKTNEYRNSQVKPDNSPMLNRFSPIKKYGGYSPSIVKGEDNPYGFGETEELPNNGFGVKKSPYTEAYENILDDDVREEFGSSNIFNVGEEPESLTSKTKKLFEGFKLNSLINKFQGTFEGDVDNDNLISNFPSQDDTEFSHGRMLKRANGPDANGNKYCRNWTSYFEYRKLERLIRGKGENSGFTVEDYQNYLGPKGINVRGQSVIDKLVKNTVLQDNGFVKIAPEHKDRGNDKIKEKNLEHYMFSIENLAWKDDLNKLKPIQKGPNSGRIMWFPPYNISFNENINVEWNKNTFIGRGEPVYTYTNTERSGNLNFSMIIDHPSMVDYWGIGDKDNKQEAEDELLRYFAGCQMLSKPILMEDTIKEVIPPQEVTNVGVEPEVQMVEFTGYFPNSYSGVDVTPKEEDGDKKPYKFKLAEALFYLLAGNGPQLYDGMEGVDFKLGDKVAKNTYKKQVFIGYEMDKNKSISEDTTENNIWGKHKYRTDKDLKTEVLFPVNYSDSTTMQPPLNKTKKEGNNANTLYISFAEFAIEMLERYFEKDESFEPNLIIKGVYKEYFEAFKKKNENEIIRNEKFKQIIDDYKDKSAYMDMTRTILEGSKTDHGGDKNKAITDLALNRGNFINGCFITFIIKEENKNKSIVKDDIPVNVNTSKTVNKLVSNYDAKKGRSAKVKFVFTKNNPVIKSIEQTNTKEEKTQIETTLRITSNMGTVDIEPQYKISRSDFKTEEAYNNALKKLYKKALKDSKRDTQALISTNVDNGNITVKDPEGNVLNGKNIKVSSTSLSRKTIKYDASVVEEYMFYKYITNADPLVRSKITEKIKYFDPAFHSMTPEGFNDRLNFLHQCTRQGSTNITPDENGNGRVANNLSFGRPPVCVLRIGDFINARIIINNMSIEYSPLKWDLNPEGIGVQPMIANIVMSFSLLGGQSLDEPISQLQNAVSNRYYANSEVVR